MHQSDKTCTPKHIFGYISTMSWVDNRILRYLSVLHKKQLINDTANKHKSLELTGEHDLRNRIMDVDWDKVEDEILPQSANHEVKSAKMGDELPLKCKNCTLEEVAVLRIVQKKPSATQKEIAAEIGKSERTVKSITIALQEKNILQRVNGKRNGFWSFAK